MILPTRIRYPKSRLTVEVTQGGLAVNGQPPSLHAALVLWDTLLQAIALGEIDFSTIVHAREATRRGESARAALQVHLRGR